MSATGLLQRERLNYSQEHSQKYEEKHDTNAFSEREVHDKFIFERFILFPHGKVKSHGRRHFKGNSGCPKEDQAHFFENTRKIVVKEYPLGNIMCTGNFQEAFVYNEMYQKGDFWLEFPKPENGS